MYRRLVILLVAFAAYGSFIARFAIAEQASIGPAPEKLSVLYAGNPGSNRMQEFQQFLEKHFQRVGTCNLEALAGENTDGYDVVVFDWTSVYARDAEGSISFDDEDLKMPNVNVAKNYSKPTVMIGVAGGVFCNSRAMAINWKCLCLENYAHDVNTEHPILQGPLPVDIQFESIDKPSDYFLYPGTEKLGEKMQAWKIQVNSFPKSDPGLVSSRENFVNTQDAEAISGGINGKGPTSVAIARHGNFLLWGFSGNPSELTDSAKNAFINSLCYMTSFDGKSPGPVQQQYDTKENHLASIYFLRSISTPYVEKQAADWKKFIAENDLPAEHVAKVGDDPVSFFRNMMQPHAEKILNRIPDEIRKETNDDIEKIIAYYTKNVNHLRVDEKERFIINEAGNR